MKVSQLCHESGVPLSSVKLYLRERLLPAGVRVGANQAEYSAEHVRRVRVIRALLHVGGLSIAAAREVLDAIDSDMPIAHAFGVAQRAASRSTPAAPDDDDRARADRLFGDWCVHEDTPGRLATAQALRGFRDAEQQLAPAWLDAYRRAALDVAEADLDLVEARPTREQQAETVVLGTILGDALFAGLRRAAQEHVSTVRYGGEPAVVSDVPPTTKEH